MNAEMDVRDAIAMAASLDEFHEAALNIDPAGPDANELAELLRGKLLEVGLDLPKALHAKARQLMNAEDASTESIWIVLSVAYAMEVLAHLEIQGAHTCLDELGTALAKDDRYRQRRRGFFGKRALDWWT